MVKSNENNCQNYFRVTTITTNDMVKCCRVKQERMMDFDHCEEYLKGVYQTKYYYGSVRNSTFSFSTDLQTDKKANNVKEDQKKKTDSDYVNFYQALRFLVLMRF